MNKITKIKLYDEYSIIEKIWDKEEYIKLSFEYDLDCEKKGYYRNCYTIDMNKQGKIVQSNSLVSSMNSLDYYIAMGEVLKQIKELEKDGVLKKIYNELENIESKYKLEIEKNYDIKQNSMERPNELKNEIEELRKKYKRLRKAEKKEEVEIVLNDKVKQLNEITIYNNKLREEINHKNSIIRTKMINVANDYLSKFIVTC